MINWNSNEASRILLVLDLNNDGKMDLIIPEHGGLTKTYINQTETKKNWVGLVFVDRHKNKINFGIQAEIIKEDGARIEYFEINPANGFKSQNDFRKIIGLKDIKKVFLQIYKPNNLVNKFELTLNEYNEIKIP